MKGSRSTSNKSIKTVRSTSKSTSRAAHNSGMRSLTTLSSFAPNYKATPVTTSSTIKRVNTTPSANAGQTVALAPTSTVSDALFRFFSSSPTPSVSKASKKPYKSSIAIDPASFSFGDDVRASTVSKQKGKKSVVKGPSLVTELPSLPDADSQEQLSSIFDAMKELDPSGFSRAKASGVVHTKPSSKSAEAKSLSSTKSTASTASTASSTTKAGTSPSTTKSKGPVDPIVAQPKVVKPAASSTKVKDTTSSASLAPPTGKALQAAGTSAAINAAIEKIAASGKANSVIVPDDATANPKLVISSAKKAAVASPSNADEMVVTEAKPTKASKAKKTKKAEAAAAAIAADPVATPPVVELSPVDDSAAVVKTRKPRVSKKVAAAAAAVSADAAIESTPVSPATPVEAESTAIDTAPAPKKARASRKKTTAPAVVEETSMKTIEVGGLTMVNGKILVDPTDITGLTRALVFAITNDVRRKHEVEQQELMARNLQQQEILNQLLLQQQEHGELLRKQVLSIHKNTVFNTGADEQIETDGTSITMAYDADVVATGKKQTKAKKATSITSKKAKVTKSSDSTSRTTLTSNGFASSAGLTTRLFVRKQSTLASARRFMSTTTTTTTDTEAVEATENKTEENSETATTNTNSRHRNKKRAPVDERERAERVLRQEYGIKFRYVQNNNISIVNVPFSYGQPLKGVDRGPQDLEDDGLHKRITDEGFRIKNVTTVDVPDIDPEAFKQSETLADGTTKLKFPDLVSKVNHDTAIACFKSARDRNFTLTIGGDHSIAIGSIAGLLKAKPNLGIIWVDAHSDINTPQTSNSGNIHGMVVSFLMKHRHSINVPEYKWLNSYPRLDLSNIVYVGLRDLDKGEKMILRTNGVKAFTMHDVDKYGIGKVMDMAVDHLTNYRRSDRPLHLSFDIDALDPDYAPATGTRVAGGLNYREAYYICESLAETGLLSSMDLVEVNASLATTPDGASRTIKMANGLIGSALGNRIL